MREKDASWIEEEDDDSRKKVFFTRKTQLQLLLVFMLVVVLIVIVVVLPVNQLVVAFFDWVDTLGYFTGPFIFVLVYALVVISFLPAVGLSVGAGFLFGFARGVVTVWCGSELGAVVAFTLGKALCRQWITNLASRWAWFSIANEAISMSGWKIVLLLRLSPLVPYNILNYVLSLTEIGLWQYVWASGVGMIPGVLFFTYLGTIARNMTDVLMGKQLAGSTQVIYMIIGFVLTSFSVIVINIVTQREFRKVAERRRKEQGNEVALARTEVV